MRSLKQCVFCSPSQMVRGSGNFFRTRYLSTGPDLNLKSKSALKLQQLFYLMAVREVFPPRDNALPATALEAFRERFS